MADLDIRDRAFFADHLARLAEAIRVRDGARALAVLEYIAAEGDAGVAADLADHMRSTGLIEDTGAEV